LKTIYIFGNSFWRGLPQRDIHFSVALARKGFNIYFIEPPNSLANILKSHMYDTDGSKLKSFYNLNEIPSMHVFSPPTFYTFFRSSIIPNLDKKIIQKWFIRVLKPLIDSNAVFYGFSPIWYFYLEEFLNNFTIKIYDVFDDLSISSRNKRALQYHQFAEKIAIHHSEYVTCSSTYLSENLKKKYSIKPILIRNGISVDSFDKVRWKGNKKKIIGLIAAMTVLPECYEIQLIIKVAERYPDKQIHIIGPYTSKHKKLFEKKKNIKLLGILIGDQLNNELANFDICLIPFLTNEVTKAINPLKMYEYLAYGKPVIGLDNFDYEDAYPFIYLAQNDIEFISKIDSALNEDSKFKFNSRIEYIKNKTWGKRVESLIILVDENL